ncbi:MAG: hypothetical protein ACRD1L_04860 [Terriglobales bacterium]
MRGSLLLVVFSTLAAVALAQTPPVGAKDITQVPPAVPMAAPSATIAAPASVIRVYVENLGGSDAATLAGLITQSLFQSKKVVVTENESSASLILKGTVLRQPILTSVPSTASATHRSRTPPRRSASSSTTSPDGLPVTSLDASDGAASGTTAGNSALSPGLDLPPLPGLDAPADLAHFRYRLDLQAVNPDGDLVWISGRGSQAPPFLGADDAVARALEPLLATLAQLKPGAGQ